MNSLVLILRRTLGTMSGSYVSGSHSMAFVTVPDKAVAKKLAQGIVKQKLAACVNIIPSVTSVYEWEGKINEDEELILMIKTRTDVISDLTTFVRENHPYDCPEVITSKMKNVILRNLYAVGMHHHGAREMTIGPVYYCKPEENVHDQHAVAIYEDRNCTKKVANFRREDAHKIWKLFNQSFIQGLCYVRAKGSIEKFSRRTGPMQSASIGFLMPENKEQSLTEQLKEMGAVYRLF